MKKYLIHPATFKLDGGAMFGIIPKPLWSKKVVPDELNRINMSLRLVLIETENRKILIDTGIGNYHSDKFATQFAINNDGTHLRQILEDELTISTHDITDIILTHLHFDHVGGLGEGESPQELIFPNAIIHLHKEHLHYAKSPTLRDSGSFQDHFFIPLLEQYEKRNQINYLTDKEDGLILEDAGEEIRYKVSFGHTPYMIHPYFDKMIYMADLVPMSHHIKLPWVMGYDIEPGTTTIYKEKFYQFIIEQDLTMIFEHDIETWGGKLTIDEKKKYALEENLKNNGKYIQAI